MNNKVKSVFNILVYTFALWGFLLTAVFLAMKLGLTKTSSQIDTQSEYFKELRKSGVIGDLENKSQDERYLQAQKEFGFIESLEEMKIIKTGLLKDYDLIEKVSKETGVEKRLLVTPLIVEQLRLMTSQREVFKKYFQPLSVLGSQTQFSLGIYGIKENTAKMIERNLKDKSSPFYLGAEYENVLDYEPYIVTDIARTKEQIEELTKKHEKKNDEIRIKRLTSEKDHYYSYLYAAIYMRQLIHQWQNSFDKDGKSFDISEKPEILMTLYNLGFQKSVPKSDPEVGGAEIDLYDRKYTFGSLAFYFYYSSSLRDMFN